MTSTFLRVLINLFLATLLVIWLSHMLSVDKYLFLDRVAATCSTHLSVSLFLDIMNLFTYVSQSTLQI
jgi:FtsH-binding integral membrane protein